LAVALNESAKDLPAAPSDITKPSSKPIRNVAAPGGEARKLALAPSVAERLSNLNELLKKNLITQDEYNAKRAQILSGI
jgi:hypothetical protein